jgi:hypothetical protein
MITPLRSNEAACTGSFIDLSSNSMRIKSNADLEVGSLQKLEVGTSLMMTEVHECAPRGFHVAGGGSRRLKRLSHSSSGADS